MSRNTSPSSRLLRRLSVFGASTAIVLSGCGGSDSKAASVTSTGSSRPTTSSAAPAGGASSTTNAVPGTTTKAAAPSGASSGSGGFSTGAAVCAAFPVAQVAAASGLSLDIAIAGIRVPLCNYENKSDPTAGGYTIQFEPGLTIAAAKTAFPNGKTVAGVGDDAWFNVMLSSGTLHVQRGSTKFFVQFVGVGLKNKPTEEQMLVINKAMAAAVLGKL